MKQTSSVVLNAVFAAHIQDRPEDLTKVLVKKINPKRFVYEITCITAAALVIITAHL